MKTTVFCPARLLIVFAALTQLSVAQVVAGTPPFSSIGGGPFDAINLGNLNLHFAVPIVHKAGRGIPFNYDLTYDSSVWTPVGSSGNQTWLPVFNWGWQSSYAGHTGYLTYSTSRRNCPDGGFVSQAANFVYHDPWGINHKFPGVFVIATGSCGTSSSPFPSTTQDGSGLVQQNLNGPITTPGGASFSVPVNPANGSTAAITTIEDANGNEISSSSSGVITDTLGTSALTIAGAAPNPVTFQYTSPAGLQHYSVNYTSYNIKTNFGCSGVVEYTATNVPLVSSISLPDGSSYLFTYEATQGFSGNKTGRLASVTLPTGGSITYAYPLTSDGLHNAINCADGSAPVASPSLTRTVNPGGAWTYGRSGSGNAWNTTISDPANNATAISFEKDSATATTNNFYETQRLSYQGSTSGTRLTTDITCYNGQSIGSPGSCFNTPVSSPITRVTAFHYLPDSTGLQSETDSTYDQFGLIHEVDEYDYGTGAVGNLIRKTITSYAALSNGIVDRPSSVVIRDSANIIRAATFYGYDENALATPSGTTPQWISVSGARGNLTSVTADVNLNAQLYRKYTYFNTGTLNTSTDVSTSSTTNGATTTYNYSSTGTPSPSCGNSFVTSISEPVGSMSRSFTWDCDGGVLLSVTDENTNTSSTAYNAAGNVFWRPSSTTDESGNTTNYSYFLTTSTPPIEFQTESKLTFNTGNSIVDKVSTTDGFGRTLFSQTKKGPNVTNYDTIATCYDTFGRVSLTTLPYMTTLATSTTACPSTNAGTSTAYDAMGRTQSISDNVSGGGSTTFSYNKNDTLETSTSPTTSKQSEVDALGRLTSVCEVTSGTTLWPSGACNPPQNTAATGYLTTYTYDVLGNRTGVTQNAQASTNHQTRSFAYDMLSRLTSETNPEMNGTATTYSYDSLTSDAACGTITSAGNLLKSVDAAGNPACFAGYDGLHRVGNVMYPSSNTPSKFFVYDIATVNGTTMTNAKTRLAEAYTCIGGCSSKTTDLGFSYAQTGQPTDLWELTPHSGTNVYYRVTATPWPNGAIHTLSNLTGLPTITYGADGEGRASTVSASSGQNPITSVAYDPASHVTALTYGSADSDAFTFDSNTGRMKKYVFTMGSTPKTDTGVVSWNPNGSLLSLAITDQINSTNTQTCNYTHDTLGRVATANCGTSVFNQNFAYDPFGNITKTVPTGSTGTAFQPNYDTTTNRMNSTPFTYNGNNGAVTADSSHGYGWDTANRLSTVDSGTSAGVCVTYDALDRVVEQAKGSSCATSPTSTTEIVYGPSGSKLALMNGSSLTKAFVALPGGAQAVYNSSGLQYYRHPDWLGSSRLATTPTRTCYWDAAYAPFGENYAQPSSGCVSQDLAFTGQNQDTETSAAGGPGGLYDFMFRSQTPVQGRWLSPDPAGLDAVNPSDPQSWNRYAYVGNRPLGSTDALGLVTQPGGPFCDPDTGFGCDSPPGPPGPDPCEPNVDPNCGTPQPNPHPPGPIGPPSGPQRVGGVFPNNETLGLPEGLNTNPLVMRDLFGLLPGLGCGSSGFAFGLMPTPVPDTQEKKPCLVPIITIAVAVAEDNSSPESEKKTYYIQSCDCGLTAEHPQRKGFTTCSYTCDSKCVLHTLSLHVEQIPRHCRATASTCAVSLAIDVYTDYEGTYTYDYGCR